MAGGGETKRKAGIHFDFDDILGKGDEPLPELVILGAPEKSKPQAEMVSNGEEVDRQTENNLRRVPDNELLDKIKRGHSILKKDTLSDGGKKLRAYLVRLEAEADRRGLYKVGTF